MANIMDTGIKNNALRACIIIASCVIAIVILLFRLEGYNKKVKLLSIENRMRLEEEHSYIVIYKQILNTEKI